MKKVHICTIRKQRVRAHLFLALIVLIFASILPVIAQEPIDDLTILNEQGESTPFSFRARLYNQTRYTPQSDIIVEIRLTNMSAKALTVVLNSTPMEYLDYIVTDEDDTILSPVLSSIPGDEDVAPVSRSLDPSSQKSVLRKIPLSSGETLLARDIVSTRYRFTPGTYQLLTRIEFADSRTYLQASPIFLTILPDPPAEERILSVEIDSVDSGSRRMPLGTRDADGVSSLGPDGVVRKMLLALQEQEWDTLYRCLDVVSIYRDEPSRNQQYINSSAPIQRQLIEEFRTLIQGQSSPLFRAPDTFHIVHTEYDDTLAIVRAEISVPIINQDEINESYQLSYNLRGGAGNWKIYSISATRSR